MKFLPDYGNIHDYLIFLLYSLLIVFWSFTFNIKAYEKNSISFLCNGFVCSRSFGARIGSRATTSLGSECAGENKVPVKG